MPPLCSRRHRLRHSKVRRRHLLDACVRGRDGDGRCTAGYLLLQVIVGHIEASQAENLRADGRVFGGNASGWTEAALHQLRHALQLLLVQAGNIKEVGHIRTSTRTRFV